MLEEEEVELLQRRLEESVRANVEGRLFRWYRNLGSALLAGLGLLGVGIGWPLVESLIKETIEGEVAEQVTRDVEIAKKDVQEATAAAHTARATVETNVATLQTKLDDLHETLAWMRATSRDLRIVYTDAKVQVEQLKEEQRVLREQAQEFKEQLKTNLVSRNDLGLILSPINEGLAMAAEESGKIAQIVAQIQASLDGIGALPEMSSGDEVALTGSGTKAVLETDVSDNLKQLADQATLRAEMVQPPRKTVYIQFAGGSRDDIKRLADTLREQGWDVPPQERIGTAAGKHEVRFFHEEDLQGARDLAEAANLALADIFPGLRWTPISRPDERISVKRPPKPGVLEVWIEIPVR